MRRSPLRRVSKRQAARNEVLRLLRVDLLARSGGRCEAKFSKHCTHYGVHAHHILPRSRGGLDTMSNLCWVCRNCHRDIHDNPKRAEAADLLRSRYAFGGLR